MGFTYKHRKLRDELRAQYTDETGRDDYTAPEFEVWLKVNGHLPSEA